MKKVLLIVFLHFILLFNASAKRIFVDYSVIGTKTGQNWSNAFSDLQEAILAASVTDSILIAQGTYFPTHDNDRSISFNLKQSITLLGGFKGGAINPSERDVKKYLTVLSGNIGNSMDSLDNSYNVIRIKASNSSIRINGVVISDGNSNLISSLAINEYEGGGIFIIGNNTLKVRLNNCQFVNNNTATYGGAIAVLSPNSVTFVDILLDSCAFAKNNAAFGAAVAMNGINATSLNQILNCTFTNNYGKIGGALYIDDYSQKAKISIRNSNFKNNICLGAGTGGAIYLRHGNSNTEIEIDSSGFYGNKANAEGGAFALFSNTNPTAKVNISNSIFENNSANYGQSLFFNQADGGLVEELKNTKALIKNCIFKDTINIDGFQILAQIIQFKLINCIFKLNKSNTISAYDILIANSLFDFKTTAPDLPLYTLPLPPLTSKIHFISNIFLNKNTGLEKSLYSEVKFKNNVFLSKNADIIKNTIQQYPFSKVLFNNNFFNTTPKLDTNGRLELCSIGINAGDNLALDTLGITIDLDGKPRKVGGMVDIGPYEMQKKYEILPAVIAKGGCLLGNLGNTVIFTVNESQKPLTYKWDNGIEKGNSLTALKGGNYIFTISDNNGCKDSIKIFLPKVPDSPLVLQNFELKQPTLNTKNGSIKIDKVSGGISPYHYKWSNGDTLNILTNLAAGLYDVTISDSFGCTITQKFELKTSVSTNETVPFFYQIYPNPTSEKLYISTDEKLINKLIISDLGGKKCFEINVNQQKTTLDLSFFPKGFYLIQLLKNDKILVREKIILQ